MPTNVNYQIPFLGGGPSIAEQIMLGLHEGFAEKQQTQQLGLQQQQADTARQRAASDVALQSAQTDETLQRIAQKKALANMFTPKQDAVDPSAAPGSAPTAAPARTDFDRIVDQSDLPDALKDAVKLNGRAQVQAGQPSEAFHFFQQQLDRFGKKVTPHVVSQNGVPYAVLDRYGEPWDLENPSMPDELKPFVDSAKKAYQQKNLLLPTEVLSTNAANKRFFGVLNPGQNLPADLTLPDNATKDEAARVDKHLKDLVQAEQTKATRDAAAAAKSASQNRSDEKFGIEPVIGSDPKSGKDVLVSQAEAKTMGLTGTMKADSQDVSKAQSARHWIPLAEKTAKIQRTDPNDPMSAAANAEDMGILQLVDDLDKRGKLGALASRWNDFMAGGVGAGDPEVEALRVKMGLSTTLLANAHVGSRAGTTMIDHFKELADAGKMDAVTLRSGVKSELDYIKDRAMLPQRAAAPSGTAPKAGGFSPDNPFAPKGQ